MTSHKKQEAGLLSLDCRRQGQKQEKKSRVNDIPTGPAALCLFRLIWGGRRSVLQVIFIVVMVSVRSLTPSKQSLDTRGRQSSTVEEIRKDRLSEQVKSLRVIFFVVRKEEERLGMLPV